MKNAMKLILAFTLALFVSNSGEAQIYPQFNPIPSNYNINAPNPVYALDIAYDSLDVSLQRLHVFLPNTTGNFPLVVFIHGGGFISGTPDIVTTPTRRADIKYFLENGIAFASVGYRLINNTSADTVGVIKCLNDAKRALQFIRHYADDLNIDPTRIALQGRSAGASASLWLSVNPDMADPTSNDPISQQSTRVCATHLYGTQATLDIYKWETQVFQNYDGNGSTITLEDMETLMGLERASNFYGGLDSVKQMLVDPAIIEYRENVDNLALLSSDDPALYINSTSTANHPSQDLFHHALHGSVLQNTAIAAGVSEVKADIPYLSINTTSGETGNEFLARYLNNCSVVTSTSSISDVKSKLKIYPNPVNNQLTIDGMEEGYNLAIMDVTGQVIKEINNINNLQTIDVSDFPNGIYFIKLKNTSTDEVQVKKFVKQ